MKIVRSDDETLLKEVSREFKVLSKLDYPSIPKAKEPILDEKFSTLYMPLSLAPG